MASGPITSRQIDGETMETVKGFILGGSKITADGDCSHEIKNRFILRRKVMINLYRILRSIGITLPKMAHLVKTMVFPVVLFVCESWTIKKAECQIIDAFELWYWRTVHPKGYQCRIFIGRTDAEAKTPILWLPGAKNWLIGKDHCWERLKAEGEGSKREWDGWMSSLTQWTWIWVNSGSWPWTGRPGVLQSMGLQGVKHYWVTELNWSMILMWSQVGNHQSRF